MIFLAGAPVQSITLNQFTRIFGRRGMKTQIDKPGSTRLRDFAQVLHSPGLEPIEGAPNSKIVGQTNAAVERQADGAVFIVQVNRPGGDAVTDPDDSMVIQAGGGLVIVGLGATARVPGGLFDAQQALGFDLRSVR